MMSPGQTLHNARIEQGLNIDELAVRTKVSVRHLNAIEQDDAASLPGRFFHRSFLQQYARALGVDEKKILADFDASGPGGVRPAEPVFVQRSSISVPPIHDSRGWGRRKILWPMVTLGAVLIGCSGFYTWWNRLATSPTEPERKKDARGPAPVPVKPVAAAPAPAPIVVDDAPAPTAERTEFELRLAAKEPTWLTLTADGKRVFSGVLAANESRSVAGKAAKLTVGNAAGVDVEFNGKPLGTLGSRGEVKAIAFTPDKFEFVPKVKPAQAPATLPESP